MSKLGLSLADAITWVVPALSIPAIRFFTVPSDRRHQQAVLDLSTGTLGAATFLATKWVASKTLLSSVSKVTQQWASTAIGMVPYVMFAGIVAPKLANAVRNRDKSLVLKQTESLNIESPSLLQTPISVSQLVSFNGSAPQRINRLPLAVTESRFIQKPLNHQTPYSFTGLYNRL